MKYLTIFILVLCISSCDYFDKKKVYSEDILKEDLKTFNWNEVDEYPTFSTCNSASTKAKKKECFETTLASFIMSQLANESIVVTKVINDTIMITFQISEIGTLSVIDINSSTLVKEQIPEMDTLLTENLKELPKIYPAIKRSQQVKTEFKLPVVIKVN
jgi:inorganic pyrophosphatase/exopolyphosphatase